MKIVVLDGNTLNPGDNPWEPVSALGELTVYPRTPAELIIERALPAEVLVTNKAVLDGPLLERLPNLRFIAVTATGYNVVDVAAAGKLGIPVANVPEYASGTVAQHVFALLLELTNRVGEHALAVRSGEWTASPDFAFWKGELVELAGKKLGIVGLGRIGAQVAAIGHAFGMEILAHNPRSRIAPAGVPVTWTELPQLFATADVVSLHCPLTAENSGFVAAALLASMQKSAYLINTARGALVNEADLAAALDAGLLAGAAVDVVSKEPIPAGNPLLAAKNCIITPHIAWATLAARQRLMTATAANIAAFLAGAPINLVNGECLQ